VVRQVGAGQFTDANRDAGYSWDASTRQLEIFRTIVFDARRHA
jgi:hypothetical protein